MLKKIQIGEMAKLNNISVQALRHYEEKGLLMPRIIDDFTGYRYYDIDQSAQLDLIQLLKSLN
ncbi:MAG: MerR family DNA-binding transcriptional regulator, partial [Streptococcaceae bacterium]|nr:MerR family DNA-binding transcriptional regulator [Streptococcaceae bacterium]